ncbi:MAG: hypothetical protein DMF53_21775 [Acidobacteria bacterium]|nr:MAG: hypothetical protein DMF53_21775 [Acidobacteriota bacterium]
MKKRSAKLTLYRETLRHLVTPELRDAVGGLRAVDDTSQSIQSGETYCWCSKTCDCCETATQVAR